MITQFNTIYIVINTFKFSLTFIKQESPMLKLKILQQFIPYINIKFIIYITGLFKSFSPCAN